MCHSVLESDFLWENNDTISCAQASNITSILNISTEVTAVCFKFQNLELVQLQNDPMLKYLALFLF